MSAQPVVLISPDTPLYPHELTIGAVCGLCYRDNYDGCLFAVRLLFHPALAPHCDVVHGVRFFTPRDQALMGHPASTVLDHLMHLRELPTIPRCNLPAILDARQHESTLFDPPSHPLTDSPEAYDPPCPADLL